MGLAPASVERQDTSGRGPEKRGLMNQATNGGAGTRHQRPRLWGVLDRQSLTYSHVLDKQSQTVTHKQQQAKLQRLYIFQLTDGKSPAPHSPPLFQPETYLLNADRSIPHTFPYEYSPAFRFKRGVFCIPPCFYSRLLINNILYDVY